jgi:peptidylprolyl isomerase
MAGMGGSDLPDIPAEFTNDLSFQRGVVGMARRRTRQRQQPVLHHVRRRASFLDGQYTIVGNVVRAWRWWTPSSAANRPPRRT